MLRSIALLQRNVARMVYVPCALFLASACANDATVGADDGAAGDDASDSSVGPRRDGGMDGGNDSTVGQDSGGTDSSVADAGEAGSRDGGNDTGLLDAGDGGPRDGGNDTGLLDAGDGGPIDSGLDVGVDAGDGGRRGPPPVNLGATTDLAAPAAYVLLAKTGITNVSGSLITGGNIGVSPASYSSITGFALIPATPPTVSATSVSVALPGLVFAADYTQPTPTNLTAAISGMQGAYTDAVGRTLPDFNNLAGGNLGGLTLTPGLYVWGTTVTIPTNVTISGGANDTWIFQISNDLDISTGTSVILGGAAKAKNIWWAVAGQATIHANAHFEGIILSQTAVTLQTMASMNGRALAQTLVALDNNAVTAP